MNDKFSYNLSPMFSGPRNSLFRPNPCSKSPQNKISITFEELSYGVKAPKGQGGDDGIKWLLKVRLEHAV